MNTKFTFFELFRQFAAIRPDSRDQTAELCALGIEGDALSNRERL
jgi:hypothetical protein